VGTLPCEIWVCARVADIDRCFIAAKVQWHWFLHFGYVGYVLVMEPSFSRGGSNPSNLKHTYFLTATFTIIFVKAFNQIFGLVGDGLGTFIFLVWNLWDRSDAGGASLWPTQSRGQRHAGRQGGWLEGRVAKSWAIQEVTQSNTKVQECECLEGFGFFGVDVHMRFGFDIVRYWWILTIVPLVGPMNKILIYCMYTCIYIYDHTQISQYTGTFQIIQGAF